VVSYFLRYFSSTSTERISPGFYTHQQSKLQESGIARDDPLTLAKLPNVRARHDYRRIEKFGFKPRISK
jgi:hypothetical protein